MKNMLEFIKENKAEGIVFSDNGGWEYERFKFVEAEIEGETKVVRIDLEQDPDFKEFEDVVMNSFSSVEELIEKGIELGFFEFDSESEMFHYDVEQDMEMCEWMDS